MVKGVRKVIGGLAVEITRHGKGFRVYGAVIKHTKAGDKTTLKRLPHAIEQQILGSYGSPYAGA